MPLYVKGTDIEIQGTLETIPGVSPCTSLRPDGSPLYQLGTRTEVDWDGQRTVTNDAGERIWLDVEGGSHPQSNIEERDGLLERESPFHVDGLTDADPDAPYDSDGQFPPFLVFDPDAQDYVGTSERGAFKFDTREKAETLAATLNSVSFHYAKADAE